MNRETQNQFVRSLQDRLNNVNSWASRRASAAVEAVEEAVEEGGGGGSTPFDVVNVTATGEVATTNGALLFSKTNGVIVASLTLNTIPTVGDRLIIYNASPSGNNNHQYYIGNAGHSFVDDGGNDTVVLGSLGACATIVCVSPTSWLVESTRGTVNFLVT